MVHRDVECDRKRPGLIHHRREHVGQMVLIAVESADHDVGIHVKDVACPACLEPGERRGELSAGRGVRAPCGDPEPPPVQRRRGVAVAGSFDDPVNPNVADMVMLLRFQFMCPAVAGALATAT